MNILLCGYGNYQLINQLRVFMEKRNYSFSVEDNIDECINRINECEFDIVFVRFCMIPVGIGVLFKRGQLQDFLDSMNSVCAVRNIPMSLCCVSENEIYIDDLWSKYESVKDVIYDGYSCLEVLRSIDRIKHNIINKI